MKKSGKFKLSLLGSIGVSLLAVSTAAVSTFAWFRAEADVQVSAASSDPVSITVSKPDDIEITIQASLYQYTGNAVSGYKNPVSNLTIDTENLGSNRTPVSNNNTITGLAPTRRKTFCLVVTGNHEIPNLDFTITDLEDSAKDTDTHKRYIITDTSSQTLSNYIKMSSAIKFTGAVNTTGSYTEDDSKRQDLVENTQSVQGTKLSGTNLNATSVYFFYTLRFVDEDSTRFCEYTKKQDNSFERLYENTKYNVLDDADRYFMNDSIHGNNSCYEGLSVQIKEISLSL